MKHSSVFVIGLLAAVASSLAQEKEIQAHSFPALGIKDDGKVSIAWNRFYDCQGLAAILKRLHDEYPGLTVLHNLGKSVEGRDLWCLEVTAKSIGDAKRKPGMWIDGNIHGNEVQAGEVVAYTAWYLCSQYERLPQVKRLLDDFVFYLAPTINPDGRDSWFHDAHNPHTSRSGRQPTDNDGDGQMDEDDNDDLNKDGHITQMRRADPRGHWKRHPDFPEYLMVPTKPGEAGEFELLGTEGIDNDGDGQSGEDPVGGYDPNRDWAWDWQPNYIQRGARPYPAQLPETRAVMEFVMSRPNIAAAQSYHNFGGMILRGPGREGGTLHGEDERVMLEISRRGEQMLPFYRAMTTWKDLYTVWGGEFDWFYGALGVMAFTNELWSNKNLYKSDSSQEQEHEFLQYLLLNDGLLKWEKFQHPLYGEIEIGGTKKEWGRVPPSFLLEEECHRNAAFTFYHADMMPRLEIKPPEVERLRPGLHRVWVVVENTGLIPTRSAQAVANHIGKPDLLELTGANLKVITAGFVKDKFRKEVDPVKRRPQRLEIDNIPGRNIVQVQFIVAGSGAFELRLDSEKGSVVRAQGALP